MNLLDFMKAMWQVMDGLVTDVGDEHIDPASVQVPDRELRKVLEDVRVLNLRAPADAESLVYLILGQLRLKIIFEMKERIWKCVQEDSASPDDVGSFREWGQQQVTEIRSRLGLPTE